MNTTSIKNKKPRYFPFYKGVYLGNEPEGYSTKQGACKFMNQIPPNDVYKEYFGSKQEYDRTHYYFYKLDMNSREYENINPERNNDFKRYDTRQRVYVNELEFDLDEILEDILEINVRWADGTVTPAPMY